MQVLPSDGILGTSTQTGGETLHNSISENKKTFMLTADGSKSIIYGWGLTTKSRNRWIIKYYDENHT